MHCIEDDKHITLDPLSIVHLTTGESSSKIFAVDPTTTTTSTFVFTFRFITRPFVINCFVIGPKTMLFYIERLIT